MKQELGTGPLEKRWWWVGTQTMEEVEKRALKMKE